MNILVTGSGGREHALGWAVARSDAAIDNLYFAPGNAGTAEIGQNIAIPTADIEGQANFATQNKVDFTIVGPDDQLANGIVDLFEAHGLAAFGPTRDAAKIEWSKAYAKTIVDDGIPGPKYEYFNNYDDALAYIKEQERPQVIKFDNLALGKGVVMAQTMEEARDALKEIFIDKKFGDGGAVIEENLGGPEVPEISLHALTDGETYKMFPPAQDHKTIFDNHAGPMTGGMGTVSPLPGIDMETVENYGAQIIAPMLKGLRARGTKYKGLIYPSIKLTSTGPKVFEYNARFGDPETQVYVRRLSSSLLEPLIASYEGTLAQADLRWNNLAAVCIAIASAGYPESSQKGINIEGIAEAEKIPGVKVFHAGTQIQNGKLVTNGGRVLNVTATAKTLEEARERAYNGVSQINFQGMQYRRDIGLQALRGF
jgi:phosphoribosylamine--glycine ligase